MSELPYLTMSERYRLRLRRKYLRARAIRAGMGLRSLRRAVDPITSDDVLLFSTCRNEGAHLPEFLDYYRSLGVARFFIVDNGSEDDGPDFLRRQTDVFLWQTDRSYKATRYGMDWINALASHYGAGHWIVCVDPDERLIYPHCETRDLRQLTHWLETRGRRSMGAPLIDVYADPNDPKHVQFDPYGYRYEINPNLGNIWMQGGPRARVYFDHAPRKAPALNKTPLVQWKREYVFHSSTHNLLPRGLNATYHHEGAMLSGALLHYKFTQNFETKAQEELLRRQHYGNSIEYEQYAQNPNAALSDAASRRYENWQQLESLGLVSRGAWA